MNTFFNVTRIFLSFRLWGCAKVVLVVLLLASCGSGQRQITGAAAIWSPTSIKATGSTCTSSVTLTNSFQEAITILVLQVDVTTPDSTQSEVLNFDAEDLSQQFESIFLSIGTMAKSSFSFDLSSFDSGQTVELATIFIATDFDGNTITFSGILTCSL